MEILENCLCVWHKLFVLCVYKVFWGLQSFKFVWVSQVAVWILGVLPLPTQPLQQSGLSSSLRLGRERLTIWCQTNKYCNINLNCFLIKLSLKEIEGLTSNLLKKPTLLLFFLCCKMYFFPIYSFVFKSLLQPRLALNSLGSQRWPWAFWLCCLHFLNSRIIGSLICALNKTGKQT